MSLAGGVRSVQETGKDAFQCFWIMSRMGLDLDIGYSVLSVNLDLNQGTAGIFDYLR